MRIFLIVLVAVLVPGLIWDFSRPPKYRAAASLLTEVPIPSAQATGPAEADVQHVTIQRRMLTGRELLAETLKLAGGPAATGIDSPEDLETVLAVAQLPETNLVELSATGGEPGRLAELVNAWSQAYEALRQRQLEEEVGSQVRALEEEQAALAASIGEQRRKLDDFRGRHDIVTLERDGNEALARLKALTADLNRARDEAVEAEARLAAIEGAVAKGEPVVPPSEQANLEALEERAAELRGQLIALQKRFTPMYLENEPNVRIIPAQLEDLEARIASKRNEGKEVMLVQARQEMEQARQRVEVMEADLVGQKEAANLFTTAFAEYEAMQKDLARLEALHQETQSRLVELQAKGLEKYPPVRVIEPASPPAAPFEPHYWRDAGFVLLAAFGAALAAVLLLEFLTRRPKTQATQGPVTGIRIFASPANPAPALPDKPAQAPTLTQAANPALANEPTASLPPAMSRELIPAEVGAMWALADPMSREIMALLLAGLTLEECTALNAEDFDLEAGGVHPPSDPPRLVPLAPEVVELFAACRPLPLWAGGNGHLGAEELSARLGLLAHDAGLAQAADVDDATLRHTYIAYLVRQGARLTELPKIVGPMAPSALARYRPLAPAGPARALDQVDPHYPAVRVTAG
jgi:uncharacterized protein involved in exopolysaccharide biosynthesis